MGNFTAMRRDMDKFPTVEIVPNINQGGIFKPLSSNADKTDKKYKIETKKELDNSKQTIKEEKDTFERSCDKENELENEINLKDFAIGLADSVPYFRRGMGLEESIEQKDYFKTAVAGAILLANVPEDFRDIRNGFNQIVKGKAYKPSIPHDYQPVFSFFRGTWFEPLLKGTGKYTGKISKFLYNIDKTLFDIDFIREKLLNIKQYDKLKTERIDIMKKAVPAYKVTEKSLLKRIFGRASLRLPLLTVAAFSLLELPSIYKAFNEPNEIKDKINNSIRQTVKSSVNVVSILGGSALFGAILSHLGPAGSLVGIGLGYWAGSKNAKFINDKIDKV